MTILNVQYHATSPVPANALGVIGLNRPPASTMMNQAGAVPSACAHLPLLGMLDAGHAAAEIWSIEDGQPTFGQHKSDQACVHYAKTSQIFFGLVEFPGDLPLRDTAYRAYHVLLSAIAAEGFPFLLKTANYIPRIHASDHNEERYHLFNQGRFDAFAAHTGWPESNAPAACALGTETGGVLVYFLAGREAGIPIENPRQVSAYHYPAQYGPRSPTFSRATIAPIGSGQRILFISGTASIVGHESLHPDDITAQSKETAANIRAVLAEAQRRGFQGTASELRLKAYIRHPGQLDAAKRVLDGAFGASATQCYLRADVCRPELLVEVEGYCPEKRG